MERSGAKWNSGESRGAVIFYHDYITVDYITVI